MHLIPDQSVTFLTLPNLSKENEMHSFIQNGHFRKMFALAVALLGFTGSQVSAQVFPQFAAESNNSPLMTEYGLGMAQLQNGLYGTALFMAYANGVNILSQALSTGGQSFTDIGAITTSGTQYQINCNAGNPETCTPAIAAYGGKAYIAFAEQTTGGLYVISASPVQGNAGYIFTLAFTDTTVHLTSAPAMVISPNGQKLLIRYGTSNIPNQQNATYVTSFDGNTWSAAVSSGGFAPTQSGLAVLGGTLYAIDKQNNSSNGMFVSQLDNNGIQIPGTPYQVPGATVKHGFSAVTYKGSIIAAVQANAPQKWFYIFSSNNGATWSTNLYSNITTGNVPQVALFNQGVTEAHQANDSSQAVLSAFASQ